jgi:short-subunit dehydrogenase
MKNEIKDKVVWVTGGSRGIGLAIADKFIEAGAQVVISATKKESFKDIIPKYAKLDNVLLFPCDIKQTAQIHEVATKIKLAKSKIDILINNAGVAKFKPFQDITEEMFDEMNAVNYKGTFLCTKQVLPDMIDRAEGVIVNILSGAAIKAFENSSVYAATKAAVLAMSRSLRKEVRKKGISVIDILPGATETDIWNPKVRDEKKHLMMQPEDVAEATFSAILTSLNGRVMVEEVLVRPQGGDL